MTIVYLGIADYYFFIQVTLKMKEAGFFSDLAAVAIRERYNIEPRKRI